MSLEIYVEKKQEDFYVISCVGSIDSETSKNLELRISSLIDNDLKLLSLNMEKVQYISSMGISVIFKAKDSIERMGGVFLLVNLQPQVKKVFEIVKALDNLSVFESMEEADRYFAKIQDQELNKGE